MHPEVQEALVYAAPNVRPGEEVDAIVYDSAGLDLDELRKFLATHLARFETPRYVVRSEEPLPHTPSGKILKRIARPERPAAAVAVRCQNVPR